jgi:hypothetical protein
MEKENIFHFLDEKIKIKNKKMQMILLLLFNQC